MDAKATVKVGPYSRGGQSRAEVKAADHDFAPDASVTPVGIFLPQQSGFSCPSNRDFPAPAGRTVSIWRHLQGHERLPGGSIGGVVGERERSVRSAVSQQV
jgi:hypothetical protein